MFINQLHHKASTAIIFEEAVFKTFLIQFKRRKTHSFLKVLNLFLTKKRVPQDAFNTALESKVAKLTHKLHQLGAYWRELIIIIDPKCPQRFLAADCSIQWILVWL